jgi:hypothetical protein
MVWTSRYGYPRSRFEALSCSPIIRRDPLHTPLGMEEAISEQSNLPQIVSPEGEEMDRRYVEQAARAERLAREMTDKLTIERLLAYAAECRAKLQENQAA